MLLPLHLLYVDDRSKSVTGQAQDSVPNHWFLLITLNWSVQSNETQGQGGIWVLERQQLQVLS